MAKVSGYWPDETATEPQGIRVSAPMDEMRHIAPDVNWPHPPSDDRYHHGIRDYPPKREYVHAIARKTEIECDDQRLIDWMRRPD